MFDAESDLLVLRSFLISEPEVWSRPHHALVEFSGGRAPQRDCKTVFVTMPFSAPASNIRVHGAVATGRELSYDGSHAAVFESRIYSMHNNFGECALGVLVPDSPELSLTLNPRSDWLCDFAICPRSRRLFCIANANHGGSAHAVMLESVS